MLCTPPSEENNGQFLIEFAILCYTMMLLSSREIYLRNALGAPTTDANYEAFTREIHVVNAAEMIQAVWKQ